MTQQDPRRRVVITGMGAITPVGLDLASTWCALLQGQSGIAPITLFDASDLDVRFAGEVKGFDPTNYLDKKEARRMDRFLQLGMVAAMEALKDASFEVTPEEAEEVGVLMGSGIGGLQTLIDQTTILIQKGPDRVSPFLIPMFIQDMLSGMISIQTGAKGPNFAAVSACATSGHALGEAMEIIKRGDAQVMIAGGAEAPITRLGIAAFDACRALSRRNDEPHRASRPFDSERDGFVLSEAAGAVILESLEHAQRRGARIYAELVGYGSTGDAYHITAPAPDGEGAARAMRIALRKAGMQPSEIGYINAHGTSTPYGDKIESLAVKAVFGEGTCPPVSSTKSMTGHLVGAGGAVEAIVCVKAILEGCLPPTINLDSPDPECDLDYVPNTARQAKIDAALSNSFGFGGHNTSLILRRFEA